MLKIIIISEEDCESIITLFEQKAEVAITPKWGRLAELFRKAPSEHTIRIIVEGGMVQDVENMPMGFYYEVQDFDICSECGGLDPECEWCKEPF